jgi:hypothetical protein
LKLGLSKLSRGGNPGSQALAQPVILERRTVVRIDVDLQARVLCGEFSHFHGALPSGPAHVDPGKRAVSGRGEVGRHHSLADAEWLTIPEEQMIVAWIDPCTEHLQAVREVAQQRPYTKVVMPIPMMGRAGNSTLSVKSAHTDSTPISAKAPLAARSNGTETTPHREMTNCTAA